MRTAQELNSLALRTRRLWNEDGYSPIDIFAIVNGWKDKKITIVRYPLSSRISGMCTKEKDDIVICINSTTSYGRQRFTLAHELYHVLYEEGMQRVICDMSMNGNSVSLFEFSGERGTTAEKLGTEVINGDMLFIVFFDVAVDF